MGFIEETLAAVQLPRIVGVRQHFYNGTVEDVPAAVRKAVEALPSYRAIRPGQSIAVTAGSRGIDALACITRTVCDLVKARGAHPFIVPAMGSHGGATAEGQRALLAAKGITEETMGVPIRATMEVDEIARADDGRPIFLDRYAHAADGIILINRVKAHTSFKGRYESGLMKMMAIGLGKQHGAETYHRTGYGVMPGVIADVGRKVTEQANILFGVATVENGYSHLAKIYGVEGREIPLREPAILEEANRYLARSFYTELDALIVERIGKEISGTGLDPNVTGRFATTFYHNDIHINKIGILSLTEASHGNATGVGFGDAITHRLRDAVDPAMTYPNVLTSTVTNIAAIPISFATDKQVVQAMVKCSNAVREADVRLSIIRSTKDLGFIYVSENMADEARQKGMEVVGTPFDIPFDADGRLALPYGD